MLPLGGCCDEEINQCFEFFSNGSKASSTFLVINFSIDFSHCFPLIRTSDPLLLDVIMVQTSSKSMS